MKYLKLSIVAVAIAVFAFACGQNASNTSGNAANNGTKPNTATPVNSGSTNAANSTTSDAGDGAALYKANCAECHKPDGKGGKITKDGKTIDPDDLTADKMKGKTDEKLTQYINDGMPDDGMPAFKDKLNAAQIKAIVDHVRTLQNGQG